MAEADRSRRTRESSDNRSPDTREPWVRLAEDYERARRREDSLDRLVEWPAERELLGDVAGRSILDIGCGNGEKAAELLQRGASGCVGIDISGNFVPTAVPGLELIEADLSDLDLVPQLAGRWFDRILFLQSLAYARDQVRTLRIARDHLSVDGFMIVARSHPIRYAVERSEQRQTSLGEEYFCTDPYTYRSRWNEEITLTHSTNTIADMINIFTAAGLWIETAVEPQLREDDRRRFPHKQAWLNKYLGIMIFRLRPQSRTE